MIGLEFGRKSALLLVLGVATALPANVSAQFGGRPSKTTGKALVPAPPAEPKTRLGQTDVARFVETVVPVNPTDPIAIVNGEVITRQQLADECVARKGQEILDTLIARRLIEQALKARKLEVTGAEIDAEIENVAQTMAGLGREAWLRTLDKEKGISPAQYAKDIIYPSIALRKLATPRVQVTQQDMNDAFEANYGERLHCRIIMCSTQRNAVEIWEELKKNPGGFEKLAKERSTDTATRSLGGLLAEPIARHAFPRSVSDAAFLQLVDGDLKDKDPTHKPKDGEVTGPIQINESAWVLVKREGLNPARQQNRNDPAVLANLRQQMFDVKLQEAMRDLFTDLMKAASVDNQLTGAVKLANEHEHPDHQTDRDVKLMGADGAPAASTASNPSGAPVPTPRPASTSSSARPGGTPAGVSADVANSAGRLTQPMAPRSK